MITLYAGLQGTLHRGQHLVDISYFVLYLIKLILSDITYIIRYFCLTHQFH